MTRIGVRELRQHASRYLDQVKQGESVEITERGRLVARLVPIPAGDSVRERLLSEGRLTPRSGLFELPVRISRGLDSGEVLDDLRSDR